MQLQIFTATLHIEVGHLACVGCNQLGKMLPSILCTQDKVQKDGWSNPTQIPPFKYRMEMRELIQEPSMHFQIKTSHSNPTKW